MTRKVMMNLSLFGRSYRDLKELDQFTNIELLYGVQDTVEGQFGDRALHISDKGQTLLGSYPQFYAAGWFFSDQPVLNAEGVGSELVVVAHGESMESARTAMMKAVEYSEWDNLAANIK